LNKEAAIPYPLAMGVSSRTVKTAAGISSFNIVAHGIKQLITEKHALKRLTPTSPEHKVLHKHLNYGRMLGSVANTLNTQRSNSTLMGLTIYTQHLRCKPTSDNS